MSLKKYLTEAELAAIQPITGDEFDISIRELTNIETVVVEHTEGSITITLDETAIKLLEHCGCTFEDEEIDEAGAFAYGKPPRKGTVAHNAAMKRKEQEKDSKAIEPKDQMVGNAKVTKEDQVDELAPLKALAGIGAKMIQSPVSKAAGQVVKSVGKTIDKKMFGPKPHEGDYEESVREEDEDKVEYQPQVGDIVQIDYPSANEGKYGEVIELAPSGKFAYVEFKDGNIESYDTSVLRQASEDEIDQHYHGEEDFEENLNSMRRLSGMSQKEGIENWNMRVTSIPRTEPFKLKKIVVKSKFGKTYTFDTEEEARRHFGKNWDKITDPTWRKANNWKLDMNNTKAEESLKENQGNAAEVIKILNTLATGANQYEPIYGKDRSQIGVFANKISNDLYPVINFLRTLPNSEQVIELLSNLRQQIKEIELSRDATKYGPLMNRASSTLFQVSQWIKTNASHVNEAEYRGRKVPLGKPMQGDVAKFKVYVKDPKTGNVKKVNFGDKNMRIKKSNPARRKSFRARHNCANPGPRTSARYWSCRKW